MTHKVSRFLFVPTSTLPVLVPFPSRGEGPRASLPRPAPLNIYEAARSRPELAAPSTSARIYCRRPRKRGSLGPIETYRPARAGNRGVPRLPTPRESSPLRASVFRSARSDGRAATIGIFESRRQERDVGSRCSIEFPRVEGNLASSLATVYYQLVSSMEESREDWSTR